MDSKDNCIPGRDVTPPWVPYHYAPTVGHIVAGAALALAIVSLVKLNSLESAKAAAPKE